MSQALLKSRPEPNLKRFSEQELNEMRLKACNLINAGLMAEADIIINKMPLSWQTAKILKEMLGIETMIKSGINLSAAVDHFGYQWLEH